MANDAPTSYRDLTGALAAAAQFRSMNSLVGYEINLNARLHYEKLTRHPKKAGDTRQVAPQAHAEQSADCGMPVRRTIYLRNYYLAGTYLTSLPAPDNAWVEVDRFATFVAGFKAVACDVRYYNTQPVGGEAVRWKIESHDIVENGIVVAAADHVIIEAAGTAHAALTWHRINGSLDAGAATDLLTIDGPTSVTDPGDTTSLREFRVFARNDGATCAVALFSLSLHEQLSTD